MENIQGTVCSCCVKVKDAGYLGGDLNCIMAQQSIEELVRVKNGKQLKVDPGSGCIRQDIHRQMAEIYNYFLSSPETNSAEYFETLKATYATDEPMLMAMNYMEKVINGEADL